VNGSISGTSGMKVVKKAATIPTPKLVGDIAAKSNGTVKSSYSAKRPIGVENSLKQELEDAVLNGQNGGALPIAGTDESTNGHSDL